MLLRQGNVLGVALVGLHMSAAPSLIPELEDIVQRGSPRRREQALRRITALFLDGASVFDYSTTSSIV
jgi:hypothetical protein